MSRTKEQFKGDAGEFLIRGKYRRDGYTCTKEKPNNEGYDFIATKKLPEAIEEIYVEVKSGPHGLSKAQHKVKIKIEKQAKIYKHVVIYVPPIYFGNMMRMLWPQGFR